MSFVASMSTGNATRKYKSKLPSFTWENLLKELTYSLGCMHIKSEDGEPANHMQAYTLWLIYYIFT